MSMTDFIRPPTMRSIGGHRAAFLAAGEKIWERIDSFVEPGEEDGVADSASEYVALTPDGGILSVVDQGFGIGLLVTASETDVPGGMGGVPGGMGGVPGEMGGVPSGMDGVPSGHGGASAEIEGGSGGAGGIANEAGGQDGEPDGMGGDGAEMMGTGGQSTPAGDTDAVDSPAGLEGEDEGCAVSPMSAEPKLPFWGGLLFSLLLLSPWVRGGRYRATSSPRDVD